MKKLFTLFLAVALLLSLAACGKERSPSQPEPQPDPSGKSESGEPAREEEPASPQKREWSLKPGKVVPYTNTDSLTWDTPYTNDGLWELGTAAEWEAFQSLLQTADVSYLGVAEAPVADTEAEFPVESELKILRALENARPDYFSKFENPATGGNYLIGAYAPDGSQIFVVTYDDFWLTVTFVQNEELGSYIFNGENLNLDLPSLEKYCSDSPLYGMDPGEFVPLGDERLTLPVKRQYGTQEDLDRWYDLIQTAKINRMVFNNMNGTPGELSAGVERQIRTLLQSAEVALYPPETREDPVTGGGVAVIAYDSEGQKLFGAAYIGNWFTVQFGEEDTCCIFNGEGSEDLGYLAAIRPE